MLDIALTTAELYKEASDLLCEKYDTSYTNF